MSKIKKSDIKRIISAKIGDSYVKVFSSPRDKKVSVIALTVPDSNLLYDLKSLLSFVRDVHIKTPSTEPLLEQSGYIEMEVILKG